MVLFTKTIRISPPKSGKMHANAAAKFLRACVW